LKSVEKSSTTRDEENIEMGKKPSKKTKNARRDGSTKDWFRKRGEKTD